MNIKTTLKSGYQILRVTGLDAQDFCATHVVDIVQDFLANGQQHFALSFSDSNADDNSKLGILVKCNEIVGKRGGRIVFLESDRAASPFFHFVCNLYDIHTCRSEEELEESAAITQ